MNRKIWTQPLTKSWCPPWPCPSCKKGSVGIVYKSLAYQHTSASHRAHSIEDWSPDSNEYRFTAWVRCKNPHCSEQFSITGTGYDEPTNTEDGYDWIPCFFPKTCIPMPHLFELPEKCPVDVSLILIEAFSLFWAHPQACAGRIRVALECLLNELGIQKRKKNKQGKYYELTLHSRINDYFSKIEPEIGKQLMALKLLGNSGSHESKVDTEDLLDAFEIMEHALSEIIERRSARINSLTKKIIKKHGR